MSNLMKRTVVVIEGFEDQVDAAVNTLESVGMVNDVTVRVEDEQEMTMPEWQAMKKVDV